MLQVAQVTAFSPENSCNRQIPKRFPLPLDRHSHVARRTIRHCGDITLRGGEDLEACFNEELKGAEEQIRALFEGDEHTVKGRAKTTASTISKLFRLAGKHKIPLQQVMPQLKDAIGVRVILKNGNDTEMDEVINKLATAVKNNELRILEVENYRGKSGIPYLSDHQFEKLSEATKLSQEHPAARGPEEIKKSGYTCVQMIVEFKNGVIGELQIRGPQVHRIAQAEHLAYDLRRSKGNSIPASYPEHIRIKMEKLKTILTGFNSEQHADYLDYLTKQYNHGRAMEIGIDMPEQPLPDSLRDYPELDMQNLITLQAEIDAIQSRPKLNYVA